MYAVCRDIKPWPLVKTKAKLPKSVKCKVKKEKKDRKKQPRNSKHLSTNQLISAAISLDHHHILGFGDI